MKALTICQPYAHLIALPDDNDKAKRIENRAWKTEWTGTLLIHAGTSRKWLALDESKTRDVAYDIPVSDMIFGAVVAVCELAGCVKIEHYSDPDTGRFAGIVVADFVKRRWPWIQQHEHAEGPYGLVLTEVRALKTPVPCSGLLGLWSPTQEVIDAVAAQIPQ